MCDNFYCLFEVLLGFILLLSNVCVCGYLPRYLILQKPAEKTTENLTNI